MTFAPTQAIPGDTTLPRLASTATVGSPRFAPTRAERAVRFAKSNRYQDRAAAQISTKSCTAVLRRRPPLTTTADDHRRRPEYHFRRHQYAPPPRNRTARRATRRPRPVVPPRRREYRSTAKANLGSVDRLILRSSTHNDNSRCYNKSMMKERVKIFL